MQKPSLSRVGAALIAPGLVIGYVAAMGGTGTCGTCTLVVDSALAATGIVAAPDGEGSGASGPSGGSDGEFRAVRKGVDLEATYDLSDPRIPLEEVHTLLPRDAIPALTDPPTQPASEAGWLPDQARVIVVEVGDEVVGVPLVILNWHEVVNMTVGGEPVAASYCPLCDSATVFSRRVPNPDGEGTEVLEFGVSGALYNSNVLMYDREDMGLWSQLQMEAVTGPRAGTELKMLPVRLVSAGTFRDRRPEAPIVSRETGHQRNYDWDHRPYQGFFSHDETLVPVRGMGEALPKKTLGVGITAGERAWFVPVGALGDEPMAVETPEGPVKLKRTDAGVYVDETPEGVHTVQTFYYAWSAFRPETEIVRE